MGTPKDSELTRSRIIEAAGQLFAVHGFDGVTVRDIVGRARTHLGALNYHFRSKESLYREVLLDACRSAAISEDDRQALSMLAPRQALLTLVREGLKGYAQQSAAQWRVAIVTREIQTPSSAFPDVVREYLLPETEFVSGLVSRIVGAPADSHEVRCAVLGLFGLLETFGLYKHLLEAVAPGLDARCSREDWLAERLVSWAVTAARPDSTR